MNKKELDLNQAKKLLSQAWWQGVNAVNGYKLVSCELSKNEYANITHVCAIGKAASSMMLAVYDKLPSFQGLLITKYHHIDDRFKSIHNIDLIESAHPIPDDNSLIAGQRLFDFVCSLSSADNLLVLVSGGASSLAEKLIDSMDLEDLKSLNQKMLSEQSTISEINAKRSQISMIKKAKLLNQCKANSITTLAISDVQGDDINIIGSGIGACELPNSRSKIIGSNKVARLAINQFFQSNGIVVVSNNESVYGDLYEIANQIAAMIREGDIGAYIFGGEPTIDLPQNPGRGGRNQSLALALARELNKQSGVVAIVAGSDGTDGPTEAAGGLIDANTFESLPGGEQALQEANAGDYLDRANALFVSGPTGTNVMDLLIVYKFLN